MATNRLASLTVGSTTHAYAFDAAGQMIQEDTERHLAWDAAGNLRSFRYRLPPALRWQRSS